MILFGSAFWDISKQNAALVLNFLTFPVDDTTTKLRKHLASLKTLFCRVGYPVMINSKYRCAASEPNGAQYVVFFQRRRKSNHSDGLSKVANWSTKFRSLSKHQFKSISVIGINFWEQIIYSSFGILWRHFSVIFVGHLVQAYFWQLNVTWRVWIADTDDLHCNMDYPK